VFPFSVQYVWKLSPWRSPLLPDTAVCPGVTAVFPRHSLFLGRVIFFTNSWELGFFSTPPLSFQTVSGSEHVSFSKDRLGPSGPHCPRLPKPTVPEIIQMIFLFFRIRLPRLEPGDLHANPKPFCFRGGPGTFLDLERDSSSFPWEISLFLITVFVFLLYPPYEESFPFFVLPDCPDPTVVLVSGPIGHRVLTIWIRLWHWAGTPPFDRWWLIFHPALTDHVLQACLFRPPSSTRR